MSVSAPVFNIQTYCIHDGPGIRSTVFVKGCPLQCLWCQNPESQAAKPELLTYASKCTGCGACISTCSNGAIALEKSKNGVLAVTDRTRCTDCGACVPVCYAEAREIAGKTMTVEEAFEKIRQDKLFFDGSGGGMTMSGGEILLYPDFAEALARMCKEDGISTAIETCCWASEAVIDRIFPHIDYAMLDIKHMDSAEHKRLTGVPNEPILRNIRHIYHDLKIPMVIRIPVVPTCNDTEENIRQTALFIRDALGPDVGLQLLPYHHLGESKSESLGRTEFFSVDVPSNEKMESLRALAEQCGVTTQIGG